MPTANLKNISLSDIVKGIILLNPRQDFLFKEEALELGMHRCQERYTALRGLFYMQCNGPEKSNLFDLIIGNMQCWNLLDYSGDYQHMKIKDRARKSIEKHLKEDYGDDILEELKPLAEIVWAVAKEYK